MVLLATMFLTACQTTQPPRPTLQLSRLAHPEAVEASGAFVHTASSMTFQPSIEGFKRTGIFKNDRDGLDISVTYSGRIASGPMLLTLRVYPEPWVVGAFDPDLSDRELKGLCRPEFESAKQALTAQHSSARVVNEAQLVRTYDGRRFAGGRADFGMVDDFGGQRQQLDSTVLVSCMGWARWVISIRATGPRGVDLEEAFDLVDRGVSLPPLPPAP